MKIELYIDDKKKTFTAPFVPMLAKRKYLEITAKAEQRENAVTASEQLDEDDEMLSILTDVVFKNKFTVEQLYNGASNDYVYKKLGEAVFGIKTKKADENSEGNEKGK